GERTAGALRELALEDDRRDLALVHGARERLAELRVVERRALRVEAEVGEAVREAVVDLEAAVRRVPREVLRREAEDVHLAGVERGELRGRLRDHAVAQLLDVGRAAVGEERRRPFVVGVALERDLLARLELLELVRP